MPWCGHRPHRRCVISLNWAQAKPRACRYTAARRATRFQGATVTDNKPNRRYMPEWVRLVDELPNSTDSKARCSKHHPGSPNYHLQLSRSPSWPNNGITSCRAAQKGAFSSSDITSAEKCTRPNLVPRTRRPHSSEVQLYPLGRPQGGFLPPEAGRLFDHLDALTPAEQGHSPLLGRVSAAWSGTAKLIAWGKGFREGSPPVQRAGETSVGEACAPTWRSPRRIDHLRRSPRKLDLGSCAPLRPAADAASALRPNWQAAADLAAQTDQTTVRRRPVAPMEPRKRRLAQRHLWRGRPELMLRRATNC